MWKKIIIGICLSLSLIACNTPQNRSKSSSVTTKKSPTRNMLPETSIAAMPSDLSSFQAMYDAAASSPEGAVSMMLVALWVYSEDSELGQKMLTICVNPERLMDGDKGHDGRQLSNLELQALRDRLQNRRYMVQSYFLGTGPEMDYEIAPPYRVSTYTNPHSNLGNQMLKVFVFCNGADNPRPVTLKNHGGVWKVNEWSSLTLSIRKPINKKV